jgi:hypothetical protein
VSLFLSIFTIFAVRPSSSVIQSPMLRAARGDVISRARGQSRPGSLPSASLRKIDIFFDERPAHLKKYGGAISFQRFSFSLQL